MKSKFVLIKIVSPYDYAKGQTIKTTVVASDIAIEWLHNELNDIIGKNASIKTIMTFAQRGFVRKGKTHVATWAANMSIQVSDIESVIDLTKKP